MHRSQLWMVIALSRVGHWDSMLPPKLGLKLGPWIVGSGQVSLNSLYGSSLKLNTSLCHKYCLWEIEPFHSKIHFHEEIQIAHPAINPKYMWNLKFVWGLQKFQNIFPCQLFCHFRFQKKILLPWHIWISFPKNLKFFGWEFFFSIFWTN